MIDWSDWDYELDEVAGQSFNEVIVFIAICVVIAILLCALL